MTKVITDIKRLPPRVAAALRQDELQRLPTIARAVAGYEIIDDFCFYGFGGVYEYSALYRIDSGLLLRVR